MICGSSLRIVASELEMTYSVVKAARQKTVMIMAAAKAGPIPARPRNRRTGLKISARKIAKTTGMKKACAKDRALIDAKMKRPIIAQCVAGSTFPERIPLFKSPYPFCPRPGIAPQPDRVTSDRRDRSRPSLRLVGRTRRLRLDLHPPAWTDKAGHLSHGPRRLVGLLRRAEEL